MNAEQAHWALIMIEAACWMLALLLIAAVVWTLVGIRAIQSNARLRSDVRQLMIAVKATRSNTDAVVARTAGMNMRPGHGGPVISSKTIDQLAQTEPQTGKDFLLSQVAPKQESYLPVWARDLIIGYPGTTVVPDETGEHLILKFPFTALKNSAEWSKMMKHIEAICLRENPGADVREHTDLERQRVVYAVPWTREQTAKSRLAMEAAK